MNHVVRFVFISCLLLCSVCFAVTVLAQSVSVQSAAADSLKKQVVDPSKGWGGEYKAVDGTIEGIGGLIRGKRRRPLPGAIITVTYGSQELSAITDLSGRYTLNVIAGNYDVVITGPGYKALPLKSITVYDTKRTTLNAKLKRAKQ